MKVAVQGASGFVGSRLVERIHLRRLAEVVPIVRSHSSLTRIARFDLDWKLADALDEDALAEAFAGCDVVFHAVAGPTSLILESPGATVRAARRAGVRRVVYLSTGVTYGFNPPPGTTDETKPNVDQPFAYNRAKAQAEAAVEALRRESGVELVVLLPSIVYGPRSFSWTLLLAQTLLSGSAFLVDDGKGICNAIYVDNLVDAMWLAGTVPGAANQDFIVSDRERVTWADLYRSVADAVNVSFDDVKGISRADALASAESSGGLSAIIGRLNKSDRSKRLKAKIPKAAKARVRRVLIAWQPEGPDGPSESDPLEWASAEQLLVQVCDVQLPIAKAERVLGYDPIPFEQGARRTGAWLRAQGFAADADEQRSIQLD